MKRDTGDGTAVNSHKAHGIRAVSWRISCQVICKIFLNGSMVIPGGIGQRIANGTEKATRQCRMASMSDGDVKLVSVFFYNNYIINSKT